MCLEQSLMVVVTQKIIFLAGKLPKLQPIEQFDITIFAKNTRSLMPRTSPAPPHYVITRLFRSRKPKVEITNFVRKKDLAESVQYEENCVNYSVGKISEDPTFIKS